MLCLSGRLRIGQWQEAWYLSHAYLLSSAGSKAQVAPVIAAPWKRSARTDWVWRHPDREYPPNGFGGELMHDPWGKQLFATEVEAWGFAVGWYRTRLRNRQQEMAREVEQYAIELGEASVGLAFARQKVAAP